MEIIKAKGTPFQCGEQIGSACQDQINQYLTICKNSPPTGKEWTDAIDLAKRYMAAAQSGLPDVFSHIQGLAKGSGIAFDDLAPCFVEELWQTTLDSSLSRACTDIIVCPPATQSDVLIAHTNDLGPDYDDLITMTESHLASGVVVLAIGIAGLYPSIAVNASHALTGNELTPTDNRVGIPRALVAQGIAFAADYYSALATALHPDRASAYNNIITTSDPAKIVSVEASATQHRLIFPQNGTLVHANKYTAEEMLKYEGRAQYPSSDMRLSRAALLASSHTPITEAELVKIMQDHGVDNIPSDNTICRHGPAKTSFSLLANMTTREVSLSLGNPCTNGFVRIY
jgi:isopenicillin-N N-acyltransferase like protein